MPVVVLLAFPAAALGATQTLTATADSYVSQQNATTNYGTATQMRLDGSPVQRGFVQFVVPPLGTTATKATLRIFGATKGPGFVVRGAANGWTESSLTWNNAPAPAAVATATAASFAIKTWLTLDVTPLVTVLGAAGGTVSFALTSTSPTAQGLASRETGTTAPQLLVDTAAATAPANSSLPTVSGTLRDGQTLTGNPGTWTGTTPISYTYQWQRCDVLTGVCSAIPGAGSATYVLTPADVGHPMQLVVTASNSVGSAQASSAQTASVTARPPVNTAAPAITGTATQGQTLTASTGTWTGTPTITFGYQWQRCDSAGANCGDVQGQTAQTYQLTIADVGSRMGVVVTGTNGGGSASANSSVTAAVTALPVAPANTSLPTISGTPIDGQTLTGASGAWTGTSPISYTYQWQRCDAVTQVCSAVAGATSATYPLASADVGSTIALVVTASNVVGSAQAASAQTAIVAARPPANTGTPTIAGSATQGQTLTASAGTWTGTPPITYTYQWQRCDSAGAGCGDVPGQTAQTYALTSSDLGSTMRVVVTGANGGGSSSANSAVTAPVASASVAPANTAAPSISGTPTESQTLSADVGTWTGTAPIAYTYQWQRCDLLTGVCNPLPGETGSTHTLTPSDVGSRIAVVVTASNAGGSGQASSAQTATIAARPPANTGASPSVAGSATTGETLIAAPGTWTGTPPITYAYRWQHCDSTGSSCSDAGSTAQSYPLTATDVGTTMRVVVTASNVGGSQDAASAVTPTVAAAVADPVIATAGDIACQTSGVGSTTCHQQATSDLLAAKPYAAILTLGDQQYECGNYQDYLGNFNSSWGRVKSLIRPVPGNHEYSTSGTGCSTVGDAAGYFDYFDGPGAPTGPAGDRGKGYYSFDIGSWHVIALNANCGPVGGCGAGSPEDTWLRNDLAAHPTACTLAYWHQPRFSSGGEHGNNTAYDRFWRDLYGAGADLVLNGHDHDYERFAPQTPDAVASPSGIREFVVGTGGKSHYAFAPTLQPNSEVQDATTFGILELTLHPTSYDWHFMPEAGATFTDQGSQPCH